MNLIRSRYALLLLSCTACGLDQKAEAPAAPSTEVSFLSDSSLKRGVAAVPAPPSAADALSPVRPSAAPTVQDSAALMIIRTGTARIEVDSLERAMASVRAMIARHGGFVVNVSMETGEEQIRRASLELKVPAARFDEVVQQLEPVGDVEAVEVTAQDVGEEYVDATARVANARRVEERLVRLLAARTGKLDEVLAVERELARVREEIERIEGRLRYLRSRVALSTLTVVLQEPAPLVSPPGQNIVGEAFLQSWRNFVRFVAGLIAALGFIAPLTAIVGALVWAGRHAWRQTRRAAV